MTCREQCSEGLGEHCLLQLEGALLNVLGGAWTHGLGELGLDELGEPYS